MEHSYFRDKISAFIDNGLNTEEQYLISLHLKECAECRALLEKLEALDSMVSRESELLPDEYFEKLASRIDKKIAGDSAAVTDISTRSSWAGLTWKITAMAASVAFLVFIGYHKDDILPPSMSKSKSASESPVIMTPGSTVKMDSVSTRRQDIAEEQPASFSSPKPSPAKLRSQSPVDGYLSDRDAASTDKAQGDVGRTSKGEQDQLQKKNSAVRRERNSNRETSSTLKESPGTEKIFIRGGRSNEANYILEDVSQEGAIDTPRGLLQGENSKKIIDKFETNATVSISQQETEEKASVQSDSNYKRARKSALTVGEAAMEKKESFADDSVILEEGLKAKDKPIILRSSKWDDAVESSRSEWLKTRDSLVATMPKSDRQRVRSLSKNNLPMNYDEGSQVDKNLALELELFELLRIVFRDSEDSLETKWAINITRQLAQFGYAETKVRARIYLDSLSAARSKSREKGK